MPLLRNFVEEAQFPLRFRGGGSAGMTLALKDRTVFAPMKFTTDWSDALPDASTTPYVLPYKTAGGGSPLTASVNDTLALADGVVVAMGWERTVADTVTLSDSAALAMGWDRSVADSVTVTDAAPTVETGKAASVADSVTLADSVALEARLTVSEALALSDSLALAVQAVLADPLAVADAVSLARDIAVEVADTLGLSDATALALELGLADALAVSDSISVDHIRAMLLRMLLGVGR